MAAVGSEKVDVSLIGQSTHELQRLPDNEPEQAPRWATIPQTLIHCIDLLTFLSLLLYYAVLLSAIMTTTAKTLFSKCFLISLMFNYSTQVSDHVWRLFTWTADKANTRPRQRLLSSSIKVDVVVTVCKEEVAIVLDTVRAACAMDYPPDKFRVLVSDDGKDDALKGAVQALQAECYPNLNYYARTKPTQTHHGFKAGNLNSAVNHADSLRGGRFEYVMVLDADMIPEREALRALAAYAVDSPKVGMVTLPQHFYNVPINDPVHQDMLQHHEDDEVMRDRLGATWCPGSGFLVSREALESVKGFPTWSIAEDVVFSWLLQGRGWHTLYVNEKLQWGLQPSTLSSHINQRMKWCVGHVHNALDLGFCLKDRRLRQMTTYQRLAAFFCCIKPFTSTILKSFGWIIKIACLCSGQPFISVVSPTHLFVVQAVHTIFWFMTLLNEIALSQSFGYWSLRRQCEFNLWLSPYLTVAIIREFLPRKLGGTKLGFTATGSMENQVRERDASRRPPLLDRLRKLNKDLHIDCQVVYFCMFVYFVGRNASNALAKQHDTNAALWQELLTTALFPGLGFEQLPAFLVLATYAIFPPTDLPRRQLMHEHAPNGVLRPRPEAKKKQWTAWKFAMVAPHILATGWVVYVMVTLFNMLYKVESKITKKM